MNRTQIAQLADDNGMGRKKGAQVFYFEAVQHFTSSH